MLCEVLMFDTDTDNRERGQVGIGTLIVFIALVLVAAIAAGVLINTAGFLQSQAEQTGQESTDQVANNIQLVTAEGQADFGAQEVSSVEATLQLAPGSDPVRLYEEGEDGSGDAIVEEFNVDIEVFGAGLTVDTDSVDTFDVEVLEEGETATLTFNDADAIQAGEDAEVVITTEDGSQTTFILSTPDPIDEDQDTDQVRLDA